MIKERARILIADEHRLYAEGLRVMLMIKKSLGQPQIVVSGGQVLELLEIEPFDLLVVNIDMSDMSGLLLSRKIKERFPDVKVLIITMESDESTIFKIANSKADGYILKDSNPEDFFMAIESLLKNFDLYAANGRFARL